MNLLDQPEYLFLKTDPRLGRNIIFLTYGGSYAYGTNVEGSDIDIRGCTLNGKADLLGCKPEHYFVLTPIGKQLIGQRKLFLSRRAINSFGGYAGQQLRRLENALAHDAYPAKIKERHIMGEKVVRNEI